jgi:hypothetical protein
MIETLLPYFAPSGVFGLIVWWIRHTHQDAIRAHDQRASEWMAAHDKLMAENQQLVAQLMHIASAVKTTTAGTS